MHKPHCFSELEWWWEAEREEYDGLLTTGSHRAGGANVIGLQSNLNRTASFQSSRGIGETFAGQQLSPKESHVRNRGRRAALPRASLLWKRLPEGRA